MKAEQGVLHVKAERKSAVLGHERGQRFQGCDGRRGGKRRMPGLIAHGRTTRVSEWVVDALGSVVVGGMSRSAATHGAPTQSGLGEAIGSVRQALPLMCSRDICAVPLRARLSRCSDVGVGGRVEHQDQRSDDRCQVHEPAGGE